MDVIPNVELHRWTAEAFVDLRESGVLGDGRFELIDGFIVVMSAISTEHATCILRTNRLLSRAFERSHYVGVQIAAKFGKYHAPVPDFALLPIDQVENRSLKHFAIDLLIEVSDTSLRYDRKQKASLYASEGTADYWILNVKTRTVEIHRDPVPDSKSPFGHSFRQVTVHRCGSFVTPLIRPDLSLAVADFF